MRLKTRKQTKKNRKTRKRGGAKYHEGEHKPGSITWTASPYSENKYREFRSEFVYPPYFDDYTYEEIKEMLSRINKSRIRVYESDPFWGKMMKSIRIKYDTRDKIIPVGTTLYRGTLEEDGNYFYSKGNRIVYFGLDYLISLWFTLEAWNTYKNSSKILYTKYYGYLHEYEVVEPIPYKFIPERRVHPLNVKACMSEPCVHPQQIDHPIDEELLKIIDHGTQQEYNEAVRQRKYIRQLGTELTVPYQDVKKYVRLKRSFLVDLNKLANKDIALLNDPVDTLRYI